MASALNSPCMWRAGSAHQSTFRAAATVVGSMRVPGYPASCARGMALPDPSHTRHPHQYDLKPHSLAPPGYSELAASVFRLAGG